ncbi:MAG: 2TM domain-containing protein [Chitinophagaceae bacterium]|jgi:hypothetical protein|nr:2TM domain-containing protein [Chitinophagaceae bacterium]
MDEQEKQLWKLARKRAEFKKNLSVYLIASVFFWTIWWFTFGMHGRNMKWPWPIWPMLGWGLALVFQYIEAYKGDSKTLVDREFEKLKRNAEKNQQP